MFEPQQSWVSFPCHNYPSALLNVSYILGRERHNPNLATPGHIRDPILKWHTHSYPPVDVQQLAAPICIHLEIHSGILEL
jgi:hypothetical protein